MCIARVLDKEGVPAPVVAMFYQVVVAAVILYGSESWCLPSLALEVLEGFHVEAARRITGMRSQKRGTTWDIPKSSLASGGASWLCAVLPPRRTPPARQVPN